MIKLFKKFEKSKPSLLLNLYNIFSLVVLMCCIISVVFLYTVDYTKDEKRRSDISFQQLEHFFEFNYRAMAEELWSGNYESISMRISDIAKKFGDAKYNFYILSNDGICLASSSNEQDLNQHCIIPASVKNVYSSQRLSATTHTLTFDLNLNKYIYFAPLNIEPQKGGYIYVTMSDPYNFYRGTLFYKLWNEFFIKIFIMIVIWLLWLLISKKLILKPYFTNLNKAERKEALGSLAAQVAHDIQSPLVAFEMIIQASREISEDKRILIRSAVGRVRDIANNLLLTYKESMTTSSTSGEYKTQEIMSCQFAASLLESIITEKRMQYRNRIKINIEGILNYKECYSSFINIQLGNFKRVISNIINNAVEAIRDTGSVVVALKQKKDNIEITIKDNGKGISQELLRKLGQEPISYGKLNGHGLGIVHAKEILSNCRGQLLVDSELNKGTIVTIILPKSNAPKWFIPEITLLPNSIICIVDDDESIHQIWKKRLMDLSFNSQNITIKNFSCPRDLISWHKNNEFVSRNILYLCDHDFLDKDINGLELINDLKIREQSILITSHYENITIQEYCTKYNLKLIPKCMAPFIPMRINYE